MVRCFLHHVTSCDTAVYPIMSTHTTGIHVCVYTTPLLPFVTLMFCIFFLFESLANLVAVHVAARTLHFPSPGGT